MMNSALFPRVFGLLAMSGLLVGMSPGCDRSKVSTPKVQSSAPSEVDFLLRPVDGDPAAPFLVETSVRGEIAAGVDTVMVVSVKPTAKVTDVTLAGRGVDGVVVLDAREQALVLPANQPAQRKWRVRVPEGVAGLVALDLAWRRAGETASTTLAVPVAAPGAKPTIRRLGEIVQERGEPVQVMAAEIR